MIYTTKQQIELIEEELDFDDNKVKTQELIKLLRDNGLNDEKVLSVLTVVSEISERSADYGFCLANHAR